jgi:large subunit ribosomal protein L9
LELILLKDVEHVGRKGDVVKVRDGFARNFLIPQNLGLPSTRANREFVEEQRVRAEKRQSRERITAQSKAEELQQLKLTVEAACGEKEKLFGSVTSEDIRELLVQRGYAVEKKHVQLKEPIRQLGSHQVVVELYPQVKAAVTVEVVRKA